MQDLLRSEVKLACARVVAEQVDARVKGRMVADAVAQKLAQALEMPKDITKVSPDPSPSNQSLPVKQPPAASAASMFRPAPRRGPAQAAKSYTYDQFLAGRNIHAPKTRAGGFKFQAPTKDWTPVKHRVDVTNRGQLATGHGRRGRIQRKDVVTGADERFGQVSKWLGEQAKAHGVTKRRPRLDTETGSRGRQSRAARMARKSRIDAHNAAMEAEFRKEIAPLAGVGTNLKDPATKAVFDRFKNLYESGQYVSPSDIRKAARGVYDTEQETLYNAAQTDEKLRAAYQKELRDRGFKEYAKHVGIDSEELDTAGAAKGWAEKNIPDAATFEAASAAAVKGGTPAVGGPAPDVRGPEMAKLSPLARKEVLTRYNTERAKHREDFVARYGEDQGAVFDKLYSSGQYVPPSALADANADDFAAARKQEIADAKADFTKQDFPDVARAEAPAETPKEPIVQPVAATDPKAEPEVVTDPDTGEKKVVTTDPATGAKTDTGAPVPGAEKRPDVGTTDETLTTEQRATNRQKAFGDLVASPALMAGGSDAVFKEFTKPGGIADTMEKEMINEIATERGISVAEAGKIFDANFDDAGLFNVAMNERREALLKTGTPRSIATALGEAITMGGAASVGGDNAGTFKKMSENSIQAIRKKLDSLGASEWDDKTRESFRDMVIERALPTEFRTAILEAVGVEGAADMNPEQAAQAAKDFIGERLGDAVTEKTTAVAKAVTENPEGSGFMGWLTSNWKHLLIPGGLLAMAFGGKVGKILGVLAMGYGGWDLYGRYKNLTSDPAKATDPQEKEKLTAIQGALETSARMQKQDGSPAPFLDPEGAFKQYALTRGAELGMDQKAALAHFEKYRKDITQAIQDTRLAAGWGFSGSIVKRIEGEADEFFADIWGGKRKKPQPEKEAEK